MIVAVCADAAAVAVVRHTFEIFSSEFFLMTTGWLACFFNTFKFSFAQLKRLPLRIVVLFSQLLIEVHLNCVSTRPFCVWCVRNAHHLNSLFLRWRKKTFKLQTHIKRKKLLFFVQTIHCFYSLFRFSMINSNRNTLNGTKKNAQKERKLREKDRKASIPVWFQWFNLIQWGQMAVHIDFLSWNWINLTACGAYMHSTHNV